MQQVVIQLEDDQAPWLVTTGTLLLGVMRRFCGDFPQAQALLAQSLVGFQKLGDRWGTAMALSELGEVEEANGGWDLATANFTAALEYSQALSDRLSVAYSLQRLGRVAWMRGDLTQARALLAESLAVFRRYGDQAGVAYSTWAAAALATTGGLMPLAARLFGAADQLSAAISLADYAARMLYAPIRREAEAALGPEVFLATSAAGHSLTGADVAGILAAWPTMTR
jgi:tetratricopeptide (TPR) repeat protein